MSFLRFLIPIVFLWLAGCGGSAPDSGKPDEIYDLRGAIVRLTPEDQVALIDHEEIPGWMAAMTMEFPVKDKAEFGRLKVGDRIEAKVHVRDLEYWITGIRPAVALIVVEKVAGQVGFYAADGQRIAGFESGPVPHEIILSPDRRFAYVSNNGILWMTDPGEGGNTITIVDIAARASAGTIDLGDFHRPHGMDIDPKTNRMVCTVENPDGLLLIDLNDRKVLRNYDVKGKGPHMVVLDAEGRHAYVSNTKSHNVAVVDLETGEVKLLEAGKWPQGAVRSSDGKRIYLTAAESDAIAIIDTGKQAVADVIKTGVYPNRVELTPDGKTLVYSLQKGEGVGFADVEGRKQVAEVPLGGPPLSLHLSRDGALAYAGVQAQDKIFVLSVADRKIVRTIGTPKGAGPDPAVPLP